MVILPSLRSKRFREVLEQRTRVKDRAKNGASKRAGRGWGRKARKRFFPLSLLIFHFLALVPFPARPKPKIPFLGLSLLRYQTKTLATMYAGLELPISRVSMLHEQPAMFVSWPV